MPKYPQLSFTGGELSPHIFARVDIARYDNGARKLRNFIVHEYGGISNRSGLRYIGAAASQEHASRLIPFTFSAEQSYALEFSHQKMRILKDGGLVQYPSDHLQAGEIVEVTAPYNAQDLEHVKYTQSADVITLCHPSYPVYELSRSDHHVWSFTPVSFAPTISAPSSFSATPYGGGSGTIYRYRITAVSENGEESDIIQSADCINRYDMQNAQAAYNQLNWAAVTNAVKYNIYRYDDYDGYSYGFLGSTEDLSYKDNGSIKPDVSDSPPIVQNPFNGSDNYPSCTSYFQQRLCFAGSNNNKQTIWMTQTGNFKNMNISRPLKDDDALEYTLASNQVNEIRHLIPLRDLIILTSGGEWTMTHNDQGITPDSVNFIHSSVNGSSHVKPMIINNSILYISESGDKVRDLYYAFEDDGYSGDDLTIFSRHLFDGRKVIEWSFEKDPNRIIWCVCSDGTLLGLTYNREHQVWGWHTHTSQNGKFKSICSIKEGQHYKTYAVMERLLNGAIHHCLEVMDARQNAAAKDGFFVDSGLSYDGEETTTISGLDHLENETVSILADGNVHPPRAVKNGAITLNYPAQKIHIGLPYEAELETLDIHFPDLPAFGQKRSVSEVTFYVKESRGLYVGAKDHELVEYKQRAQKDGFEAIPEFTGEINIRILPDWESNGALVVKQKDPLPITLLSATPHVSFSEE